MARAYCCDVPGCGGNRKRWQRLCEPCFAALPAAIRNAITRCWRYNFRAEHRIACKRAAEFIKARADQQQHAARDAYVHSQRMLGERE